jgi:hypothetical protein
MGDLAAVAMTLGLLALSMILADFFDNLWAKDKES